MSSLRLAKRRAIITGATAGIGEAIARRFAAEGAQVVLVARERARGEALLATLDPSDAVFVAGDVAERETAARAVEAAVSTYGGVDVLVNNAGIDFYGDFLDADWQAIHHLFEVNFFGQVAMTQAVVKEMKEAGGGAIVNIASRTAMVGVPTMALYGASKGALVSLTRALAVELAPYAVRVNTVLPGLTATPLVREWLAAAADPAEAEAAAISEIPLARLGAPSDVAAAVLYLASEDASFVTGAVLPVDGGYTAR